MTAPKKQEGIVLHRAKPDGLFGECRFAWAGEACKCFGEHWKPEDIERICVVPASEIHAVLEDAGIDYGDVPGAIRKLLDDVSEWQGKHLSLTIDNARLREALEEIWQRFGECCTSMDPVYECYVRDGRVYRKDEFSREEEDGCVPCIARAAL